MVIGAFPIAKLGILVIRQISKPIGMIIKRTARRYPFFKSYVVAPTAQVYNKIEVRSKLWMLNMGQPNRIPPLSNDMAIQMGGDILSELLIFVIGVSLILNEFSRQARNDRLKHDRHRVKRALLTQRIEELSKRVRDQDKELQQLKAQYYEYHESNEQECL